MLYTSLLLLFIAIIAALLGYHQLARASYTAARVLAGLAILLAGLAFVLYWIYG